MCKGTNGNLGTRWITKQMLKCETQTNDNSDILNLIRLNTPFKRHKLCSGTCFVIAATQEAETVDQQAVSTVPYLKNKLNAKRKGVDQVVGMLEVLSSLPSTTEGMCVEGIA
jgi:hypothetical protein